MSWASSPPGTGKGMAGLATAEHLWALAVIAGATAALTLAARRRPGRWLPPLLGAMALLLLVVEATWWVDLSRGGGWTAAGGLPLQLCDTAALVVAAALWWRSPLLVELTWFWGLAGSVQGLLTPDLPQHFPGWWYFQYYAVHGLIVSSAIVLVVGVGLRPRRGALVRVLLITAVYTVLVAVVDLVTGGNYMYLRQPPPIHSLLDLMGPWPWYILGGAGLALVLFWVLDLPFRVGRRLSGPSTPSASRG
jgi:hypothetical integral membrane protein (TIGR02206 family)